MRIEEQQISLAGHSLHRLVLHPGSTERGSLIFFHGQGDFIDRYPPILLPWAEAGYRCILTDLPGHGRSAGRRGCVPGLAFIDDLLDHSLDAQPFPHLIAGHSMGGLLALRLFLNNPERFAAAWFSSPLLDPMHQAKPWMKAILPALACLAPWLTVSTGVSTEDCTDDESGRPHDELAPLYHSRISFGWGRDLRDAAQEVAGQFPDFPAETPALFTQGGLDHICPADILNARLGKLFEHQLTYTEIKNARHEPFSGSTLEEFLSGLRGWIKGLGQRPLP